MKSGVWSLRSERWGRRTVAERVRFYNYVEHLLIELYSAIAATSNAATGMTHRYTWGYWSYAAT